MQEALALVRRELGPEAAVLHTREVRRGRWPWSRQARWIEVTASNDVVVPSRWAEPERGLATEDFAGVRARLAPQAAAGIDLAELAAGDLGGQLQSKLDSLQALVWDLCKSGRASAGDWPESLFGLFTDLLDAEMREDVARDLIERLRRACSPGELADRTLVKRKLAALLEAEIAVAGPIATIPGQRRLVALVGPTGVGKTTTIAKLAAHFRLREKRRVGLITVDTYRVAAVEQLRTYADIIDLPMEVVSTPREVRQALARLADQELILMDTAGRSPRDDVKVQELRAILSESQPDEVHLVLSSVAGVASLIKSAQQFAPVGTTALLLTKLDESSGLGNLLPLVRECPLPLSYLTNGQSVPDDIEVASADRLARVVLGLEAVRGR